MKRIGLAFLFASGAIYGALLLSSAFGWSRALAFLIAVAVVVLIARSLRRRWPIQNPNSKIQNALDAATLVLLAVYASFATAGRASHWDFFSIWGLKARSFFEARTIDWRLLQRHPFLHGDYPLLVPLNFDFYALLAGTWSDRWIGVLYVAFAAALLLLIRGDAAEEVSGPHAAAIALASTSFVFVREIGLAELPLLAFATAAILLIRRGDTLRGAILLGLAASTKNEGGTLIAAVAIALAIDRKRDALRLWPAFAIAAPWWILRAVHGLSTDLTAPGVFERLVLRIPLLPSIGADLVEHLPKPWIWIPLLAGLFFVRGERFALLSITLWFASILGAYMITPHDPAWHIATSWSRLAPLLGAPLLVIVMLALARAWSAGEDRRHAEARSER